MRRLVFEDVDVDAVPELRRQVEETKDCSVTFRVRFVRSGNLEGLVVISIVSGQCSLTYLVFDDGNIHHV